MAADRRGRQGLTVIEAVISLCVIGALFLIVVPRYQRLAREAGETALKAELANIRATLKLFRLLNGRYPESLRELTVKKILIPEGAGTDAYRNSIFNDRYLLPNAMDGQGNIIDAFGFPYVYEPATGMVKSGTVGYENW